MNDIRDRAIGAFIGLAVGDALGTTVEFKERGDFPLLTDMIGGGVFRLKPGEWTDDTSMALCVADNILAKGKVEPYDLMVRFARWYHLGENGSNDKCFDIGTTCVGAIRDFEDRKAYKPAADRPYLSGNGSIMRLAPVATRWHSDRDTMMQMAVLQGQTTHGSAECMDSCMSLAEMLYGLIQGEYDEASDPKLKGVSSQTIPNSGYVMDTMLAARWAFTNTNNFNDCVLEASNLGGDADTIAAVAGQLAGAKYGLSGIREDWVAKLAKLDHLITTAEKLFDAGNVAL